MNHDIDVMPCSITDGLQFDDEYVDPYDRHEISEDEARQQIEDDLDDELRGIGALYKPGFMFRRQA